MKKGFRQRTEDEIPVSSTVMKRNLKHWLQVILLFDQNSPNIHEYT